MLSALQDAAIFNVPLAFLWISFIVELTPGPNMTYLAALTLVEGWRAGFATVAGVAAGLLLVGVLAAFGVAAFVSESPILYGLIRWLGVFYMLWLAYDIWRGVEPSEADKSAPTSPAGTYFGRWLFDARSRSKSSHFLYRRAPAVRRSESNAAAADACAVRRLHFRRDRRARDDCRAGVENASRAARCRSHAGGYWRPASCSLLSGCTGRRHLQASRRVPSIGL
jgi:hypothetical protein